MLINSPQFHISEFTILIHLSLYGVLQFVVYDRNIFGSSSEVFGTTVMFGNFWKVFGNERDFGNLRESCRKSSENRPKRRYFYFYMISKIIHGCL